MRLLITLILSSFFSLVSQNSDAAGKIGFNTDQAEAVGLIAHDLTGYSEYSDEGSIALPQVSLRLPSSQYRTVQGILPGCLSLPSSAYEIVDPADQPTKSFSHCVPIGLMLLFPKHYFW